MTRIEAIKELLKEPTFQLNAAYAHEILRAWDTRETALRALVETLKNEAQALRYMVGEQARRGALNACAVAIEEILEPPQ